MQVGVSDYRKSSESNETLTTNVVPLSEKWFELAGGDKTDSVVTVVCTNINVGRGMDVVVFPGSRESPRFRLRELSIARKEPT